MARSCPPAAGSGKIGKSTGGSKSSKGGSKSSKGSSSKSTGDPRTRRFGNQTGGSGKSH